MGNFNMLPLEIISDILTRLPAELVLECKSVSKPWRNLIQHPLFSKMHTNRQIDHSTASAYSTDSGKLGFLALALDQQLYYFEYTENYEIPKLRRMKLTSPFEYNEFVGSFNGLICLHQLAHSFCICNPMTKEFVILPRPKINLCPYTHRAVGFGYVAATNEYKVVLVHELEKQPNFAEVMVYTLGNCHGWRNIGKFDLKFNRDNYSQNGIYANGALHWMHRVENMILVFDLADENFRERLSRPFSPLETYSKIGVMDGFLLLAHGYFSVDTTWDCNDIWLYKKKNDNYDMTEQDEHQSLGWIYEFKAAKDTIPLAFTKSGGVLDHSRCCLNIYDPKSFTSKRLVDIKENFGQVFPHKNTLVSLKELGEVDTHIMESVKY